MMRFHILETTREYGIVKLAAAGSGDISGQKHLAHYLALAEKAAPELTGPHQGEWLARLETEHDNLRAALTWALNAPIEGAPTIGAPTLVGKKDAMEKPPAEVGAPALRLVVALGRFWLAHGWFSEGRESLALAIQKNPHRSSNEQGYAVRWAGRLAYDQADYDVARRLLNEGLTIFRSTGDKKGEAAALNDLGNVALRWGDCEEAKQLHLESLAILRELGDTLGIAILLGNLGNVAKEQGDYEEAKRLQMESLAIKRELGDKHGIAMLLNNLGNVALRQGDHEEAKRLQTESLAIKRELGDKQGIAMSLYNLGNAALEKREHVEAKRLQTESLILCRDLGEKEGIAYSLEGLGNVAASEVKPERAAKLLGAADTLRAAIGSRLPPSGQKDRDDSMAKARAAVGENACNRAFAEGRAMTLDAAIQFALEDSG